MPRATPGCLYALKGIREQMLDTRSELYQHWYASQSTAYQTGRASIILASSGVFVFNDHYGPICAFWGIAPGAELLRLESASPGVARIYMQDPEAEAHESVIAAHAAWHAYYLGNAETRQRERERERDSAPKLKFNPEAAAKAKSLFGDL